MNTKPTLIVSHDAGGANLLLSWCLFLQDKIDFVYFLSGPAEKIYFELNLNGKVVNAFPEPNSVSKLISSSGWQTDFEALAICWARANNLYCITFLDHWSNYKSRFEVDGIYYFPDEVWTSDDYSYDIAHFHLSEYVHSFKLKENYYFFRLKNSVITSIDKHVLICLEPIRDDVDVRNLYSDLVDYLELNFNADDAFILRDHPSNENSELKYIYEKLSSVFSDVKISNNSLSDDLSGAICIFGYQSTVLALSLYIGVDTKSFFPIEKIKPYLPHSGIDYIFK